MEETKDMENVADLSALVDVGETESEPGVYEVGYHIVPTIPEEALEGEVKKITAVLKGFDADFVGERFPAHITLAYPIEKKIDGTLRSFATAYFGWIAFAAPAPRIAELKAVLDANQNILRSMIIATSRDQVAATVADPGLDAGAPEIEDVIGTDTDGQEAEAEVEEAS